MALLAAGGPCRCRYLQASPRAQRPFRKSPQAAAPRGAFALRLCPYLQDGRVQLPRAKSPHSSGPALALRPSAKGVVRPERLGQGSNPSEQPFPPPLGVQRTAFVCYLRYYCRGVDVMKVAACVSRTGALAEIPAQVGLSRRVGVGVMDKGTDGPRTVTP